MMVPDLSPLFYLAFIALGALAGAVVSCILFLLSFVWPVLATWTAAPILVGMAGGFIFALVTEKK